MELRHHKPSYLPGEANFCGMLFGADDEVYFSVNQGRPFSWEVWVGRFFEYFAEVRLGTCNEWNGMHLLRILCLACV